MQSSPAPLLYTYIYVYTRPAKILFVRDFGIDFSLEVSREGQKLIVDLTSCWGWCPRSENERDPEESMPNQTTCTSGLEKKTCGSRFFSFFKIRCKNVTKYIDVIITSDLINYWECALHKTLLFVCFLPLPRESTWHVQSSSLLFKRSIESFFFFLFRLYFFCVRGK